MRRQLTDGWRREPDVMQPHQLAALVARSSTYDPAMTLRRALRLRKQYAHLPAVVALVDRIIVARIRDCWDQDRGIDARTALMAYGLWKEPTP